MIREVLKRRFKRAILEKGNYLTLPDLILIDGGKGQYSTAKEVLNEFGLHDLQMIAIAKGKFRNSGNETFFCNGKSYKFERNDPVFFLLQRLRDEAHRFAITYHRNKRSKKMISSELDAVLGIGPKKKKALINFFGSVKNIRNASYKELIQIKEINKKDAEKIKDLIN